MIPAEILTVLVLYQMKLGDSEAFTSLSLALERSHQKGRLFVYDNSTGAQLLPVSSQWDIQYNHDAANPGVSRAYNQASQYAKKFGMHWLLFADQDTSFPESIYERFLESMNAFPDCKVFVPVLCDHQGIVSPFQPGISSGTRFRKVIPGRKSFDDTRPINSGLMVDLDLFMSVGGYDERLRLDFSDFNFVRKLQRRSEYFVVVDAPCKHELSTATRSNITDAVHRFKIYLEGSRIMGAQGFGFVFRYRSFLRAVKLSFQYRTTRFIDALLSSEQ